MTARIDRNRGSPRLGHHDDTIDGQLQVERTHRLRNDERDFGQLRLDCRDTLLRLRYAIITLSRPRERDRRVVHRPRARQLALLLPTDREVDGSTAGLLIDLETCFEL